MPCVTIGAWKPSLYRNEAETAGSLIAACRRYPRFGR
jgi:hypothetical protein